MINAVSSAVTAMRTNMARFDVSAARVAGQTSDPVPDLIDQIQIKTDFQADVAVLRVADEIEQGGIRLWA